MNCSYPFVRYRGYACQLCSITSACGYLAVTAYFTVRPAGGAAGAAAGGDAVAAAGGDPGGGGTTPIMPAGGAKGKSKPPNICGNLRAKALAIGLAIGLAVVLPLPNCWYLKKQSPGSQGSPKSSNILGMKGNSAKKNIRFYKNHTRM